MELEFINDVLSAVLSSKKYANLHRPLIERACIAEYPKYKNNRDRVKAVKNRLHLLYGAYLDSHIHRKAEALMMDWPKAISLGECKTSAEALLRLHASTNERLPYTDAFYEFIFNGAGAVESILDLGCGFNPFTLPWMPLRPNASFTYYAYDIDLSFACLINRFFASLGIPQAAGAIDLAVDTPPEPVDLAFIFKLIPVLEGQRKGRGFQLLREINARRIAVTFPLKSLGGRERGMAQHYGMAFEGTVAGEWGIDNKAIIGDELVYLLER